MSLVFILVLEHPHKIQRNQMKLQGCEAKMVQHLLLKSIKRKLDTQLPKDTFVKWNRATFELVVYPFITRNDIDFPILR